MLPGWMVDLLLQATQAPAQGGPDGSVPSVPGQQAPLIPGQQGPILPGQQGPGPDPMAMFRSLVFPLVAVLAIFWLLIWRPEGKKRKERQLMIQNVKKGDTVVTTGGLIGKVWRADSPGELVLIVDKDKDVKARFSRSAILEVLKVDAAAPAAGQEAAQEAAERAKS